MSISCVWWVFFFIVPRPNPVCIYGNDAILPKGVRTQNLMRVSRGSGRALLGFAHAGSCGRNRIVCRMFLCMSGFLVRLCMCV